MTVAGEIVGGLKQQPLVLALVVLALLFGGLNYWLFSKLQADQHERSMKFGETVERMWNRCLDMAEPPRPSSPTQDRDAGSLKL